MDHCFNVKLIIIISLFVISCKSSTGLQVEQGAVTIYTNSFESAADTVGWRGYGAMQLRNEGAPGAGSQSLFISGGCIIPHAEYDLPPLDTDAYVKISCWGKNLANGGEVGLKLVGADVGGITIGISDTVWTFLVSKDSIYCPVGQRLRIELVSGGIVYSAMLIDLIEVTRLR